MPILVNSPNAYVVAVVANYVVVLVKSRLGSTGAAAVATASEQLGAQYARFAQLFVLYPDHEIPDRDERDAVGRTLRRFASVLGAVAIVHVGGPLKAGLTRALLGTAHLTRGSQHPTRAFDDVDRATIWLQSELPGPPSHWGFDCRRAIRELQREFEDGRGSS